MDIKKHKSYMEFYYKILSFNNFGELKKYLKFHPGIIKTPQER